DGARWLLLAAEVALALPLAYLLAVVIGATFGARPVRRQTARDATPTAARFALIVPAHNEELLIGATLASLAQLDYPADRYTVHVVADNCTDRTAEIARGAGAQVYERTDAANRGKGYALAWMFDQLAAGEARYDAYVILDADTVVEPLLLHAFSRGLASGTQALQAHNAVLNADSSPSAALRWIALSLMNYVRPLGRNTLGGSSTLTGNGVCLTPAMLARHPWQAFGLSEDYQYYLTLVAAGERVVFVPDAHVYSVMPTTVRQLQTQDIRWESISPDARGWQRRIAWRLFADGVRKHDWTRLDALAELLTPPLSALVGACALVTVAALALLASVQLAVGVLLIVMLFAYVGSAFYLLRPPGAVYRALFHAPAYIIRKLWVYFVLRRQRRHTSAWVRTARVAPASEDDAA
ncbi:MAG TPA: glycosyltransferase family 2 protein, partial [Ktedonobacterales bacterium]|nr:glycosyltransferase family 2 protein [Ktedonobacterales bacterium]